MPGRARARRNSGSTGRAAPHADTAAMRFRMRAAEPKTPARPVPLPPIPTPDARLVRYDSCSRRFRGFSSGCDHFEAHAAYNVVSSYGAHLSILLRPEKRAGGKRAKLRPVAYSSLPETNPDGPRVRSMGNNLIRARRAPVVTETHTGA